jgi:hypothetical protein
MQATQPPATTGQENVQCDASCPEAQIDRDFLGATSIEYG